MKITTKNIPALDSDEFRGRTLEEIAKTVRGRLYLRRIIAACFASAALLDAARDVLKQHVPGNVEMYLSTQIAKEERQRWHDDWLERA